MRVEWECRELPWTGAGLATEVKYVLGCARAFIHIQRVIRDWGIDNIRSCI